MAATTPKGTQTDYGTLPELVSGLRNLTLCDFVDIYLSGCNTGCIDPSEPLGVETDHISIAQRLAEALPYTPGHFEHRIKVYGAAGYNALNIIMDAVQRAGGTEPDKLRAALEQTDYEGPNGHFTFDAKHQAVGFSVVLVRLEHGKPTVVASNTVKH